MNMSMGPAGICAVMNIAIRCPVCDHPTDHYESCAYDQLKKVGAAIRALRENFSCPRCTSGDVEMNDRDFYECGKCHTQYTTGSGRGEGEPTYLTNRACDYFRVAVLPHKGSGQFKYLESEKVLTARIKELQKTCKRTVREKNARLGI